jgi:hypothetical protein
MSDERPGEQDAYRPGRESGDTEGHKRFLRATDTDEPPKDEDTVGNAARIDRVTDDVLPGEQDGDRTPPGDMEGHAIRSGRG